MEAFTMKYFVEFTFKPANGVLATGATHVNAPSASAARTEVDRIFRRNPGDEFTFGEVVLVSR